MKITEHITKAKGKTLFSFEIVPPLKGQNIQKLYDNIDPLMEFNPPFIDVTTSREEYVYIEKEGGLLEQKVTRMRPGTVGICASLKHKYNIDPVPHVLCGGFSKQFGRAVENHQSATVGFVGKRPAGSRKRRPLFHS